MKESALAYLAILFVTASFGQKVNIGAFKALDHAAVYWTDDKPSLKASNSYETRADFRDGRSYKRVMIREIFEGIEVVLDYSYVENDFNQKEFTEINVHYTELCERCDLRVKFSTDQFRVGEDPKSSDSIILMTFTLIKDNFGTRTSSEVVGTLITDGQFHLKKGGV